MGHRCGARCAARQTRPRAHRAGALLGRSKTTDVVDASLVALAIERGADIVTGDRDDIERLVAASGERIAIVDV